MNDRELLYVKTIADTKSISEASKKTFCDTALIESGFTKD